MPATEPTCDLLLLCAGLGTRLRPLTDSCPKPLLPLCGASFADRALAACAALPLGRRYANAHHLPGRVEEWARDRRLDGVQVEPVILDTGGALARAEIDGRFGAEHVCVHNGDLVHDIDLAAAWRHHFASRADATLVVIDQPAVNTVRVLEGGFAGVERHPRCPAESAPGTRRRTFSGIAFYRRALLAGWPPTPWTIKDLWHDAWLAGRRVLAWEPAAPPYWEDCGQPAEFARAAFRAARQLAATGGTISAPGGTDSATSGASAARIASPGISVAQAGPSSDAPVVWIHPRARVGASVRIEGSCIVEEGAVVEEGAGIVDSILLPGARAAAGETVHRAIRNPSGDCRL